MTRSGSSIRPRPILTRPSCYAPKRRLAVHFKLNARLQLPPASAFNIVRSESMSETGLNGFVGSW
jgi:hypothetical protein